MAAEVIGIIASVSALAKALIEISKVVNSFARVNEEARSIYNEVQALSAVNESLKMALEANKARPNGKWLRAVDQVISSCKETTKNLHMRLPTPASRMNISRSLRWTLKRSDVKMYCNQLRSYSQMLGLLQGGLIQYFHLFPFSGLDHSNRNDSESGRRLETMAVEALIKLTELQRGKYAQSPAAPTEYGLPPPPIPGLSPAAQEAINGTEYGSTQPPPDYYTATDESKEMASLYGIFESQRTNTC
jgi:hypothetical protein